jgi:hypothetical protein
MEGKTSENSINLGYKADNNESSSEKSDPQLVSAKYIPVRCSWIQKPRKLRVHHSRGEFELDIQKFMNDRGINKFYNNYQEGDLCYLTYFRLQSSEKNTNYIYGIYNRKNQAMEAKLRIRSAVDLYNRIQYTELEDENIIEFGRRYKLMQDKKRISVIYKYFRKILRTPVLIILYSILGYVAYYGGSIIRILCTFVILCVSLVYITIKWVDINTYRSIKINDISIPQRNFDNRNKVVLAQLSENKDQVIIELNDIDSSWTFEKNDFGDLCGYEKNVVQNIDEIGDKKVILRVQRNINNINGLKSDDGQYILPNFEQKIDINGKQKF